MGKELILLFLMVLEFIYKGGETMRVKVRSV